MSTTEVSIKTTDGDCRSFVCTPQGKGSGPWPAVIFFVDAGGIRPAMLEMGQRLADAGYVVLVPDIFYRYGPYGPFVPKEVFRGDFRAILGPLMSTTGPDKAAKDSEAYLAYLDTRSDVARSKVGTVGFCMGGGMAIATAGSYPDRIAAAASFHGGNLATDAANSPVLFVPKIRAEVYLGVADNDGSYPPAMAERFEAALKDANVKYTSEIYSGAAHGWMMTDFPVFDEPASERGWSAMLALFERALK